MYVCIYKYHIYVYSIACVCVYVYNQILFIHLFIDKHWLSLYLEYCEYNYNKHKSTDISSNY